MAQRVAVIPHSGKCFFLHFHLFRSSNKIKQGVQSRLEKSTENEERNVLTLGSLFVNILCEILNIKTNSSLFNKLSICLLTLYVLRFFKISVYLLWIPDFSKRDCPHNGSGVWLGPRGVPALGEGS